MLIVAGQSNTVGYEAHFDSKGTLDVGRLLAESLQHVEAKLQPARRQFTIVTFGDSITKGGRGGV